MPFSPDGPEPSHLSFFDPRDEKQMKLQIPRVLSQGHTPTSDLGSSLSVEGILPYCLNAIPLLASLFGIYLTSLYNYLLFHSLAEGFSIVIASGIFMIAWNARRLLQNHYLLFIGIAYLYVGGIDFVHMLA